LQSGAADAASIAVTSAMSAVELVAGLLLAQLFVTPSHLHRRRARA